MPAEHYHTSGKEPQPNQEGEGQPSDKREITFKETVRRADKATTELYEELADLARKHAETDPSLTPEYVQNQLKRRDANKAGRDRVRNHLLEMMSREHKFTFEGNQSSASEKPVHPAAKDRVGNLLRKVGTKINKVFPRK